jgi:hypothetical protein
MGKSTERATKASATRGHASPFFKSGESRGAFFQPKLAINTPGDHLEQEADRTADQVMSERTVHGPATSSAKVAASVQRQEKSQTSDVVTQGLSLTYETLKDQPGFEEWKEKQTAALKFKLWENQPTDLKVGLISFGLSSAGILGSTLALDPHYRREALDTLQDTNVLLPLGLLPYSEYFPLSGFKYKLPTAADSPYTFQTEFDFDAWFKLAREQWNIPKVSLSVGVDSAYQEQGGFSALTGGHIKLKFGGGIVNLTGFYNEPLPPTPMLISDPTRGEPPVWLMRSLPGQLDSNLPRGSGVFLTVDVLRLPELFKSEVPKRDKAVQRKEDASGAGTATASTPEVAHELHSGTGEALPPSTLSFMEDRFGNDFSNVRVHRSERAAESAESINARAYTSGIDIVFNSGEYQPHTPSGQRLLAHELAHTVQQTGGVRRKKPSAPASIVDDLREPGLRSASKGVRRQPKSTSPSELQDPISLSELQGFGFYAIGPEFTGVPQEADVRQVLGETGVADAKALSESTPTSFKLKGGDPLYFAYIHPSLGVVARGYADIFNPLQKDPVYSVYAYINDKDSTKFRPVGGTGEKRKPIASLGVMSGVPPLRFADLYAGLRLLETRLSALSTQHEIRFFAVGDVGDPLEHPAVDPAFGGSIEKAQADIAAFRSTVAASPAQAQTIETALQLLEWVDYDLTLLDQQRAKLVADSAPTRSVNALRARYGTVLKKLLQPDAMASYEEAQRWAERLPVDVMLDALRAFGERNKDILTQSATLVAWVDDLRKRIDTLYDKRQRLAAQPGDPTLTKQVQEDAAFLEAAVRGIQIYAQWRVAIEQFARGMPGITDYPLIKAMSRLSDRVEAIKLAYDAHDTNLLKARVDALEADQNVKDFYRALPAAMQVTRLIAKIGVTTLAAMATGGVGGLLTGGARAAATGITLRGALTFAGTAVLEAATFTAVNATASKLLFDEKISFGSLLKDFAWNLGLFFVLRAVSGVSTVMLRAAELQALSAPVQLVAGFPFAHGWGVLRFRIEQNRWPTKVELDQMTAESVLMMAAIAVGSKGVQRYIEASKTAKSLSLFYREYGWRFEALETLRTDLGESVKKAEAGGKGNDPAELDAARAMAKTLEEKFQQLLDTILKDKRFQVPQIRQELNALRDTVPDVAAELLAEVLGIPLDVGVRRAGKASYTYASGKTSALEASLSGQYTVTKTTDATGLKTVTAESAKAPTLVFQERTAGALDLDTGLYDVQKLMLDFSLTDPDAQKMLWRMLSDNGIAKDAKQATTTTRKQVRDLATKAGKSAEEVLRDLHKTGRLRSAAPKVVVETADRLDKSGILQSAEWLEARGPDNQRGVVGEWLAKETVPPPAGSRVLRRVTVQADLFEDAAGTVPAKDSEGRARVNVTAAETDVVYARDVTGTVEVDTVINVKASGEKGMAKSATVQNANFEAVLKAKPGDLVKLQLADGVRYARIKGITALDGGTVVDLTGKLKPATAVGTETVGPKGAAGFSKQLAQDKGGISAVAEVLNETQLTRSGEY